MGLTFRERIIINGALTTLLAAFEDPKIVEAIAPAIAKLVAVGTLALETIGYGEMLSAAKQKAIAAAGSRPRIEPAPQTYNLPIVPDPEPFTFNPDAKPPAKGKKK